MKLTVTDYRSKREQLARPKVRKMAERRDYQVRPPHKVFESIDMKGGDVRKCWPWTGYLDKGSGACVFHWRNKRHRAQRIVYALRNGIPFESVPILTQTCGNPRCCNPKHLMERFSISQRLVEGTSLTIHHV